MSEEYKMDEPEPEFTREIVMSKDDIQGAVWQILQAVNSMETYTSQPIEIKNTETMGRGLFATRDIDLGEFITTFPSHFVIVENKEFGIAMDCYKDRDIVEEVKNGLLNEMGDWSLGLLEDLTIVADPEFTNDNRLWGHLANDLSYSEGEEYDLERSNCGFKLLDIHATKVIKAGEQLSLCYGPAFWASRRPFKKDSL
tara:strand:- start:89 stop:682 length:594 start_codon:yes stop_codon:yes gene_type:complete